MASESNSTLGQHLRQEREKRGITIEQVASATKINVRLLHSLEEDQYGELPAKPFVRGFVNSYARFIGLDPQELLTRFGDFIDKKAHDRPSKDSGHSGYAFEKREGEQSRTILWIVLGSFMACGGLAFIILKPSLKHHKGSHIEKLRAAHSSTPSAVPSALPSSALASVIASSPVPSPAVVLPAQPSPSVQPSPSPASEGATAPSPVPSGSPSPKPSAVAEETSENDPLNSGINLKAAEIKHKVIFKATGGSVWVRYQVDQKPMMKFILRQDRVLVLRAKESIRFQVSNPKFMTFNYNSRGAKPLESEKNLVTRQDTATLYFPSEISETIQEPFPGEKPLSKAPVPPAPQPSPTMSPNG